MREQTFTTTRRHLLWAAGAGAALLAGVFLLGVQAGKQSSALKRALPADSAEPLEELPAPLIDQLQIFETGTSSSKPMQLAPAPKADAPKPDAAAPDAPKVDAPAKQAEAAADKWTLQLVSTKDNAEAKKIAAQAKAAGYPAVLVKDKNTFKVRLSKSSDRAAVDTLAGKLKKAGFKPFAVRVE